MVVVVQPEIRSLRKDGKRGLTLHSKLNDTLTTPSSVTRVEIIDVEMTGVRLLNEVFGFWTPCTQLVVIRVTIICKSLFLFNVALDIDLS